MTCIPRKQQGASPIAIIIILAIIGIGVFIGLQYIPQRMESGTIDTILSNIEKDHQESPFQSTEDIMTRIANQLNVNEMNDMMGSFKVTQDGQAYVVKVNYDRELNLIYEKKPMPYEKVLTLN